MDGWINAFSRFLVHQLSSYIVHYSLIWHITLAWVNYINIWPGLSGSSRVRISVDVLLGRFIWSSNQKIHTTRQVWGIDLFTKMILLLLKQIQVYSSSIITGVHVKSEKINTNLKKKPIGHFNGCTIWYSSCVRVWSYNQSWDMSLQKHCVCNLFEFYNAWAIYCKQWKL